MLSPIHHNVHRTLAGITCTVMLVFAVGFHTTQAATVDLSPFFDNDNQAASSTPSQQTGTSSSTTNDDDRDARDKDKEKKNNSGNTATTTQATSTTPSTNTGQPTATSTNRTPANQQERDRPNPNPEYNASLESVLNTVITPTPEEPLPKKTSTTTRPATTTTVRKPATATSTKPTTATTTAAARTTQTPPSITGIINSISGGPSYYTPFDTLSPESTYALSGVAMLIGIVGATLVLRDPQRQRTPLWVPNVQEPLLES